MKKIDVLLSLFLFSVLVLAACEKKEEITENTEPTEVVVKVNNCEKAVQKYLEGADKNGKGNEVKKGDNIVVDYIGRLEDGTVFDTSIQSIAEACDKYNESRDYTEGLSFEAQGGQMVKGFDNGVIGMKIGQTKTVQFGPEEGYGEYDKTKVETYTSDELGDLSQYEPGMMIQKNYYEIGIIKSVTDKKMVVDFNHELAGKNLIFDITLKSIN